MKHFVGFGAALVLGICWTAPARAGTTYKVTDLANVAGVEADGNSYAEGVNDLGQVVVTCASDNAFMWSSSGGVAPLNTPAGGYSAAYAISNNGYIAGQVQTASGAQYAAVWTSPSTTPLNITSTMPSGTMSIANAISSNGIVVGTYTSATTGNNYAFSWSQTNGLQDLTSTATNGAGWVLQQALGVNASGQIVGTGTYDGNAEAFLDNNGTITALSPASAIVAAINDKGNIVGNNGAIYPSSLLGAIWAASNPGAAPQLMSPLGGSDVYAAGNTDNFTELTAVNSNGDIVGNSGWTDGTQYPYRPVLIPAGGQMTDLNSLLDPAASPAGTYVADAYGINASDVIVGDGYNTASLSEFDALVLIPETVPEPISMILFGTGIVGVFGFVSRRMRHKA